MVVPLNLPKPSLVHVFTNWVDDREIIVWRSDNLSLLEQNRHSYITISDHRLSPSGVISSLFASTLLDFFQLFRHIVIGILCHSL